MMRLLLLLARWLVPGSATLLPKVAFALSLETVFVSGVTTAPIGDIVGRITNIVLVLLGIIFFIILLFGVFTMATGGEEGAARGKQMLAAGIIGLVIVLAAAAIANFLVGNLISSFSA